MLMASLIACRCERSSSGSDCLWLHADGLPHRVQVRAVELWLRDSDVAAEMGRRLQEAGLTRTWSMLQEQVR